jgi:ubiquinone/menaquinone biosynthesis C-methylase UbiE
MSSRLKLLPVRTTSDIRNFFDHAAADYQEQHGPGTRLLRYRLNLIKDFAEFEKNDRVLEIGCGPGNHLIPLTDFFSAAIGTDLSEKMIESARQFASRNSASATLSFAVDNAETLSTIANSSMDVAFCVGAFEHMVNKKAVLQNVFRVLKPKGRFVCLTPNGDYFWYRRMAPMLGLQTTRLSTDHFVDRCELLELLETTGFALSRFDYWTFIPKGDMPKWCGHLLEILDLAGRAFKISSCRGGLVFSSVKAG